MDAAEVLMLCSRKDHSSDKPSLTRRQQAQFLILISIDESTVLQTWKVSHSSAQMRTLSITSSLVSVTPNSPLPSPNAPKAPCPCQTPGSWNRLLGCRKVFRKSVQYPTPPSLSRDLQQQHDVGHWMQELPTLTRCCMAQVDVVEYVKEGVMHQKCHVGDHVCTLLCQCDR